MEKCAQSVLSVFLVFALGIWTLRYEPLVSGSSCSLFGYTFLTQCLVRLWIHVLRLQIPWCSSWVGRRHVRWCATTGLWSDSGENCGFRSCIPLISGRCPWFAGRADSLVHVWRRQSSPTDAACPYVFLDKVVDMPLLCNGRCLVFGAETADSPQLQFID